MSTKSKKKAPANNAIRRVPLEQFGYIEIQISIDLTATPKQVRDSATKQEKAIDAYKQAFWDLMKENKAKRNAQKDVQTQEDEAQRVEQAKADIAELLENEPDAIKAKVEEFNGLIDDQAAAALILKNRQAPKESAPASGGPRKDAPSLPDTGTFFKGKFGWSLYTDPAALDGILAWLISIPAEERGRKSAEPSKSKNGKAIYCNDKEKAIYKAEAVSQGKRTFDKEST